MPHLELLPAAAHYSVLIVCGALTEITCCTYRVWNINLYTGVFVKIRENPNEWLISCFVLFLEKRTGGNSSQTAIKAHRQV